MSAAADACACVCVCVCVCVWWFVCVCVWCRQVSYRVQRDEPPSFAVLVLEGPDAGKYRDERTGVLYETSSDWIRAMVRPLARERKEKAKKKKMYFFLILFFFRVLAEYVDSAGNVSGGSADCMSGD